MLKAFVNRVYFCACDVINLSRMQWLGWSETTWYVLGRENRKWIWALKNQHVEDVEEERKETSDCIHVIEVAFAVKDDVNTHKKTGN
jgi:hypothetical protein